MTIRTEEREKQDDSRRFGDTRPEFWAIIRCGWCCGNSRWNIKHYILKKLCSTWSQAGLSTDDGWVSTSKFYKTHRTY